MAPTKTSAWMLLEPTETAANVALADRDSQSAVKCWHVLKPWAYNSVYEIMFY